MKFNTKLLHAGIHPDPSTGAIMTPIFQTSTYVQDAPGVHKGYEYARTQNPTRNTLENQMAALEGGCNGMCFGSGMAATDALLKTLKPGDEIIASNDLYGGTYRLFTKIYQNFGITSHFVDMTNPQNVTDALNDNTKLVWIETPTNPLLSIIDIKAIAEIAASKNVKVAVDNTFASPYLQQPLSLGADFVIHSATKYLGGHSDVVMGIVVCKHKEDAEQIYFIQNSSGGVAGPQDSFLVLRGIKTLHLRVERASQNTAKLAEFLKGISSVNRVLYPGLPEHPNHSIANRQMSGFGGMLSFDLKGDDFEQAKSILSNTKVFALAESLGGVESLLGHPASMTHASIPREERLANGLSDSLIRLSVGVEDVDDLIQDLRQAINA